MPLPSNFDPAEFAETMERIAAGESHADTVPRPAFDPMQHREVVEECVHGRKIMDYVQALERAGFAFWPKGSIPPGLESRHPLEPPRPLMEGQWRRPASRHLPNLAMTEDQIVAWFSSPKELWEWLINLANQWKTKAAERDRTRPIKVSVPR